MRAQTFFMMSLVFLSATAGVAANPPEGRILPETYEGQMINPGNESSRQMEVLLRRQYVKWVLSQKVPGRGDAVDKAVPEIRLPRLRLSLEKCAQQHSKYRHPKPEERSLVSVIRVRNDCAEGVITKALEP